MRWFFSLLFFLPLSAFSQSPVYHFSDDWMAYHDRYESYVPLAVFLPVIPVAVSLPVDLSRWQGYRLHIRTSQTFYFYCNARLYGIFKPNESRWFDIDSLRQFYPKSVWFTFRSTEKLPQLPYVAVEYPSALAGNHVIASPPVLNIIRRDRDSFHNFLVITALLLAGVYALLWNLDPGALWQYYQPAYLFNFSEKSLPGKSLDRIQLAIAFSHSLLMAFGWLLLLKMLPVSGLVFSTVSLGGFLLRWLGIGAGIMGAILLKYALIYLTAGLLRIEKVAPVHFYQHLAVSVLFYPVFAGLVFVLSLQAVQPPAYWHTPLLLGLGGFHLLRSMGILVNLNRVQPFQNMYLFSYFCTVEVIPLLIGFRYFGQLV
jgi:hypothetical protein